MIGEGGESLGQASPSSPIQSSRFGFARFVDESVQGYRWLESSLSSNDRMVVVRSTTPLAIFWPAKVNLWATISFINTC